MAGLGAFCSSTAGGELPQVSTVCTEMGCESGVTVRLGQLHRTLRRARSVTLCVDHRCGRLSAKTAGISVRLPGVPKSPASRYRVELVVQDGRGSTLQQVARTVTLLRSQPNGPDCEPTCYFRLLTFEPAHRRLALHPRQIA